MKRRTILVTILAVLLVVPFFYIFQINAATGATITVTADSTPTIIGQTFVASINIAGATNLWAWNGNVTWNPAVLNATKIIKGPFLTSNGDSDVFPSVTFDNVNGFTKGGPSQALLDTGSVSGDGVLAKITFLVVGSGTSDISLNNIRLLDPTVPTHLDESFTQGQTLTISIPSSGPTPTPSSSPTPTPSSSPTPTPTPTSNSQPAIHVFTNNMRYVPGDLVQVFANVTANGAGVASKDVAFTVKMQNNTDIATMVNGTDTNGIASIIFRIPVFQPVASIAFGNWSVLASVDVSQTNLTGSATFAVGYSLMILKISVPNSVQRLGNLPINVTLQNFGNTPQGLTLTVSIMDSAQVPIGTTTVTINTQTQGNLTITTNLTVPSWAFTGQATVYANILTTTPDQGGVPYCSQGTTQFQIS